VLIECWALLILNTLTPAIDQLPKIIDNGYECKSWATAYIEFYLNSTHVLMIVDMLNENQLKFMRYCQFSMILGVGQICVNQAKNI